MRMPTYRTEFESESRSSGFTLVELLAVLAIMAIAASAFSFGSGKALETARFRALMLKTSAALTQGRIDAIRQARENLFVVDIPHRQMGFGGGQALRLPSEVSLKATVAGTETLDGGRFGIRFYPAGNSSGGTLAFSQGNLTYELRVNWLTGNVSLQRI